MLAAPFLATSCEKDIDINYKEADQLYVVEASITNISTKVAISKTRQITTDDKQYGVDGATISITGSDGSTLTLTKSVNGIYSSSMKGKAGVKYDIDIDIDGHHFTSSSTMQKQPVINSFGFVWKKVLTTKVLFADLRIQDFPDETNYYFMHIYRNGLGYRWAVVKDNINPNEELQQLFSCMSEDSDDASDVLNENDNMRVEVRAIDKASYDYLFSMQQTSSIATNPIANFTGGCLGYFSAYGKTETSCRFTYDGIEEE